MHATLNIEMDNAAFLDDQSELARILRELADKIEDHVVVVGDSFVARDVNGNRVGSLEIKS